MDDMNRFFVITGGPGSGKSTLIDALALYGFSHMPEAGRAIIQEQVAIGGTALPWSVYLICGAGGTVFEPSNR